LENKCNNKDRTWCSWNGRSLILKWSLPELTQTMKYNVFCLF